MASISRDGGGRKRLQFAGADGKRKTTRLGKMSMKQAEAVKVHVEELVGAAISGHTPSKVTAEWLAGLDDGMIRKLAQGIRRRRT